MHNVSVTLNRRGSCRYDWLHQHPNQRRGELLRPELSSGPTASCQLSATHGAGVHHHPFQSLRRWAGADAQQRGHPKTLQAPHLAFFIVLENWAAEAFRLHFIVCCWAFVFREKQESIWSVGCFKIHFDFQKISYSWLWVFRQKGKSFVSLKMDWSKLISSEMPFRMHLRGMHHYFVEPCGSSF